MVMTSYTRPVPIPMEERLTLKTRFPSEEDCALCLQSMKGCLVMRMPCGHHYHERCHARLREAAGSYRYRCPTCRRNVKEQIQRMKVYDLWGDDLWDQYQCYVRSLDGGAAPWDRASGKRRLEVFEQWLVEGLDEEELDVLFELGSPESAPQPASLSQDSEEPGPEEPGPEEPGPEEPGPEEPGPEESTLASGEWIYSEHLEEYLASLALDPESGDEESRPDSP